MFQADAEIAEERRTALVVEVPAEDHFGIDADGVRAVLVEVPSPEFGRELDITPNEIGEVAKEVEVRRIGEIERYAAADGPPP